MSCGLLAIPSPFYEIMESFCRKRRSERKFSKFFEIAPHAGVFAYNSKIVLTKPATRTSQRLAEPICLRHL